MHTLKNKTQGFTLIELLVVIAIIGILSSVVIASLNSVRGKANDARRISDIRQIKAAVNSYANDNGSYPSGVGCIGQASGTKCWNGYTLNAGGSGIDANPTLDAKLSPYLNVSLLSDPKPNRSVGDRYVYAFNSPPEVGCVASTTRRTYVAFMPESGVANSVSCSKLGGYYACCGGIACGSPNFCVAFLDD
ncbi:MAG: hypothetical protein RI996_198 [Candidatus Parcubacteria bacterium]